VRAEASPDWLQLALPIEGQRKGDALLSQVAVGIFLEGPVVRLIVCHAIRPDQCGAAAVEGAAPPARLQAGPTKEKIEPASISCPDACALLRPRSSDVWCGDASEERHRTFEARQPPAGPSAASIFMPA
jgi:hypothetical protein